MMNTLTTNEATKRLGASVRRVHALIGEGKLEAHQLGCECAIDEAAL
jgi:excisionase family DNA binding protein